MKKLLFVILSLFAVVAYADNTITSKEYVDGQVSSLQTQIPAKNTNTVVMNTGTAGTIGEKAIYDTTAAYGAQSDALVTAGAFNSAVQNALESEFVCTEWLGDVHDNAHCLLYEVRGAVQTQTLPSGYTQLEYLESTGTQWINTDYLPNNLTNFEIQYNHTSWNTSSIANCPYGTTTIPTPGKAFYGLFRTVPGASYLIYNRIAWGDNSDHSNIAIGTVSVNLNTWYTDKYLQNQMYINNNLVATSSTLPTIQWSAPNTLWLFARNGDSGVEKMYSNVKISYAKAWESGGYIFNLIPVRRDSDGVLGMYDTVTGTFFTNRGTGEFIAGPVVSSNLYLPSGN